MIASLLVARGSALDEPNRSQMASVAARAAVETERGLKEARFTEYRSGERIFVALSPELKNYALALGEVADRLAGEDPIPSPATVLEALRKVKVPEFPEGVTPPSEQRLCQLAAAASTSAALSSRMEIYPLGLAAERALMLAQNALFGGTLTVEEIRSRVAARFPLAEPLPDRPQLDGLIEKLGLDLKWNVAAAGEQGAYEMPGAEGLSLHTSESVTSRLVTRTSPAPVIEEVPPEICDLDAAFLDSMRKQARTAGAEWKVVLQADAAPPDSPARKNLQMLVERCLPEITSGLRSPDRTRLVTHAGLLARYDRMDLLGDLAADVGRADGIFGLWVLIPASDKSSRPTLNHKAVPLSNPAQHVRLNRAWLANKHRA